MQHVQTLALLAAVLAIAACAPKHSPISSSPDNGVIAHEVTFNFDTAELGPPADFRAILSGDGNVPGNWQIRRHPPAVTGDNVVAQLSADRTNNRFPLLIYPGLKARDVDVWVHLKPISGAIDQAGGIVIRFQDKDNYYIARANVLENNVRLYKVVNGQRIQFAGTDARVTRNQWHLLKLSARGNRFEVSFNGQPLFQAEDDTFNTPGHVGLWTKADSVTMFDNLKVETYDAKGARMMHNAKP